MMSVTQTGLIGIRKGMQGMQKAASEVASENHLNLQSPGASAPRKDIVESMIDMKKSSHQVQASVQVVKAADEAIGSILDLMA